MGNFGAVASNQALTRVVDLNGTNFRKGVTAPTDATIGATPTVPALLFDAVAELASTTLRVPDDWDSGTDPVLVFKWSLVNVQINLDTADFTLDYTVSTLATAEGPDKTSTQLTVSTDAVTGRLSINDVYETSFTFARADASNPIAAGDLIHLEFHLTNVAEVAAIHLLDAAFRYEASY